MINVARFHFLLFQCQIHQVTCLLFYASLGVEISGIDRTTTDSKNFKSSCETFISRMIIQEAKLESTERCSCKIYGRNFDMFIKFASTC